MDKTGKAVLIISVVLGLIFISLVSLASNGYGYMGYYGYLRGPSWGYWGAPPIYYEKNVRNGSVSGSGYRGGGPGSGK